MSNLVKLLLLADSDLGKKDAEIELAPDLAAKAVKDGLAKEVKELAKPKGGTKVRLLVDCEHGKANAVVTLSAEAATAATKAAIADADPAAVKYAEKLAKAAEAKEE